MGQIRISVDAVVDIDSIEFIRIIEYPEQKENTWSVDVYFKVNGLQHFYYKSHDAAKKVLDLISISSLF